MFTRLIFRKPFQVGRAAMVEIELYVGQGCPADWSGGMMNAHPPGELHTNLVLA
jgi:hypothetical protein